MQAVLPTFTSKSTNPEGGVFIITSSIAGRTIGGSCMPYSVTKAAQLHLMRCLAKTQGPAVRVNAVLPGCKFFAVCLVGLWRVLAGRDLRDGERRGSNEGVLTLMF